MRWDRHRSAMPLPAAKAIRYCNRTRHPCPLPKGEGSGRAPITTKFTPRHRLSVTGGQARHDAPPSGLGSESWFGNSEVAGPGAWDVVSRKERSLEGADVQRRGQLVSGPWEAVRISKHGIGLQSEIGRVGSGPIHNEVVFGRHDKYALRSNRFQFPYTRVRWSGRIGEEIVVDGIWRSADFCSRKNQRRTFISVGRV